MRWRAARRTTAAALLALAAAGAPLCSKDPFDESPGARLALYAYSFGDYRGELSVKYKPWTDFKGWHHRYVFTDRPDATQKVAADGWAVCTVPEDYMPPLRADRPRVLPRGWELTKYFKFGHVADVLKRYDYVLHNDMNFMSRHSTLFHSLPSYGDIDALVRSSVRRPDSLMNQW